MTKYEIASGSIVGRDHTGSGNVLIGENNQDAFEIYHDESRVVAVACDGCGSQSNSEFGAQLGAGFISKALFDLINDNAGFNTPIGLPILLESVRQKLLAKILSLAKNLGVNFVKTIDKYFLFTVVGTVVDGDGCNVFSLGDGYYAVNGRVCSLGPFDNNEPPYLAYGLIGTKSKPTNSVAWKFQTEVYCPPTEFKSVMVGTDGIKHLIAAENKNIPGKDEKIGDLGQFWTNDVYFENSKALQLRLALINRSFAAVRNGELKREPGRLSDDVTIAVIRKKSESRG